jgi:hypothetical protein
MPIWTIESSKLTAGATVDVRFKYHEGHIAGMVETGLQVWGRPAGQPCADWTLLGGSVDSVHNLVSVTGLTGLGQFTLGDVPPSPTAVAIPTLGVYTPPQPWEMVTLVGMLGLIVATVYRYRRHGFLASTNLDEGSPESDTLTEQIAAKVVAELKRQMDR